MPYRAQAVWLVIIAAPLARAAEFKYAITIDGKAAGGCVVTSKVREGATELRIEPSGPVDRLPFLNYCGNESWKDSRLVQLETSGSDLGRKRSVTLVSGKDGYALKTVSKEVTVRSDVWPTSFWIRPAPDNLLIVDVNSGEVSRGKVEKVGPEQMQIDGKLIRVTKYRLTFGGATTELWYDQADRLTRRKWDVNGRTIVMELTRIKAD
jgi:hypothetical protein